MLWEILLAVLAVGGLIAGARYLAGRFLYPVRGAVILLPAAGSGAELEHQLQGLRALSEEGRIAGETVLLADLGLDPEGRELARQLMRKYPELYLCVPEEDARRGT